MFCKGLFLAQLSCTIFTVIQKNLIQDSELSKKFAETVNYFDAAFAVSYQPPPPK